MRSRRLAPVAAVLALVATLSTAAAIAAAGSHPRKARSGLALSGHVTGLVPGAHRLLTITVRNRLRRTVHLRSISTTVHAAASGCSGRNVVVADYHGRRGIAAGRWVRVHVRVSMRLGSPAACQGKVFPLTFRGQASA